MSKFKALYEKIQEICKSCGSCNGTGWRCKTCKLVLADTDFEGKPVKITVTEGKITSIREVKSQKTSPQP